MWRPVRKLVVAPQKIHAHSETVHSNNAYSSSCSLLIQLSVILRNTHLLAYFIYFTLLYLLFLLYFTLLTYLLTYLLTPWSRVLLEKLTGSQLVKKYPALYGT